MRDFARAKEMAKLAEQLERGRLMTTSEIPELLRSERNDEH